MENLIINTNPHIMDEDKLKKNIVESIVASFKLEGIEIFYDEAWKIIEEVDLELKKQKQ